SESIHITDRLNRFWRVRFQMRWNVHNRPMICEVRAKCPLSQDKNWHRPSLITNWENRGYVGKQQAKCELRLVSPIDSKGVATIKNLEGIGKRDRRRHPCEMNWALTNSLPWRSTNRFRWDVKKHVSLGKSLPHHRRHRLDGRHALFAPTVRLSLRCRARLEAVRNLQDDGAAAPAADHQSGDDRDLDSWPVARLDNRRPPGWMVSGEVCAGACNVGV